jgi:hypothetical protein
MVIQVGSYEGSVEVEIIACTPCASRKRVEDAEIFQALEENTDSDVTIFSSEEDEDGYEPDSDEDGKLDDNSETNEDGCTRTSGPKTLHLKWTNTLNFKELEEYENLSGPKYSLIVGSSSKGFELFVTNDFYNKVAEETNKYAALSQRKPWKVDNKWEDTNAEEIRAHIGILIYMGLVDLPEIEDYFQADFCVCPIVTQAMTLKAIQKTIRRKVVRQLIGTFASRKHKVRKSSLPIRTASPIVFHTLKKYQVLQKCVLCV